jgi:MFS family permease
VWGLISDRIGRRVTTLLFGMGTFILVVASAFATNWVTFLILRTGVGIFTSASHVPYSLFSECCPAQKRGTLSLVVGLFWSVGTISETGMAWILLPMNVITTGSYEIKTWRVLMLISSFSMFAVGIMYPILPESPRYLYVTRQYKQCSQVIKKMLIWNGKSPMVGKLNKQIVIQEPSFTVTFSNLFRNGMWRVTPLVCSIWFCNALIYYGIVVMTGEFFKLGQNNDAFIQIFITSAAELPAFVICLLMINPIGRRWTLASCLTLSGVSISLLIIPAPSWALTMFSVLARMGISGAFSVAATFTREVFPTVVRNTGTGLATSTSIIGSILTMFVGTSLFKVNMYAAVIIYAAAGITGAIMALLIPMEMSGKALLEVGSEKETTTLLPPTSIQ